MSERIFATQGEVLEFLHSLGLKIGRSKLSADYRSGRLKCTSDKQFREDDVLAYAESLKAPAVQEKADKAQKLKAELARQKALLSSLLEAVPDDRAVKLALEKWLAKNSDEEDNLCGAVREALGRMGNMEPSRHASRTESLPSGLQAEASPSPAKALPELVYLVQGSASTPYKVRFRGEGPDLVAFCSCPAGKMSKTFCKHAAALLKGDASRLVDGSVDLAALRSRANGSPLLDKAQGYTAKPWSHRETIAAPGAPDQGLKRLLPNMDRLLEQTTLWHEYRNSTKTARRASSPPSCSHSPMSPSSTNTSTENGTMSRKPLRPEHTKLWASAPSPIWSTAPITGRSIRRGQPSCKNATNYPC